MEKKTAEPSGAKAKTLSARDQLVLDTLFVPQVRGDHPDWAEAQVQAEALQRLVEGGDAVKRMMRETLGGSKSPTAPKATTSPNNLRSKGLVR